MGQEDAWVKLTFFSPPKTDQYLSDTLAQMGAKLLGRCLPETERIVITEFLPGSQLLGT